MPSFPEIDPLKDFQSLGSTNATYLQGEKKSTTGIPVSTKDSITSATSSTAAISSTQTTPLLESPQNGPMSLNSFFSLITESLVKLNEQLEIAKSVEALSSARTCEAAAAQAANLNNLVTARNQAALDVTNKAEELVDDLSAFYDEINIETNELSDLVSSMNEGAKAQMQAFQDLITAYDTYIKNIEGLGAIKQADGTYLIPKDKVDEYNTYTIEYQKSVDKFNSYWTVRKSEIEDYNTAVNKYNGEAAAHNAYIDQFQKTYNTSYLPHQQSFALIIMTGALDTQQAPSTISPSGSLIVNTYPPSTYAQSQAKGMLVLATGSSQLYLNIPLTTQEVSNTLYNQTVLPFDDLIEVAINSLSMNEIKGTIEVEPLLNEKPLLQKILSRFLEDTAIEKAIREGIEPLLQKKVLDKQVISDHIKQLLGGQLISDEIKKINPELTPDAIRKATEKLMILSMKILQNQGHAALFPSLSILAPHLESLSKDHPAFSLLFALSFLNRIQEGIIFNLAKEPVESYLKGIPELSKISPKQLQQLTTKMNMGMLGLGLQLLEKTLGLSGLFPQLLDAVSPSTTSSLALQAFELKSSIVHRKTIEIQKYFAEQGMPKNKAEFLAGVGSRLLHLGFTPNATSISPTTVDFALLTDSLTAALLTSDPSLSVDKASNLSHQAVKETMDDLPFVSVHQFRTILAANLHQIGINADPASIGKEVVIVAPSLSIKSKTPLSEIRAAIDKAVSQIVPGSIVNQVSSLIGKTLFPSDAAGFSQRKANIETAQSPRSAIELLASHIEGVHLEKDKTFASKQWDAFKETIEASEDFYKFSLKLMDPAYLFIYSIYSGIIYSSPNKDKKLII